MLFNAAMVLLDTTATDPDDAVNQAGRLLVHAGAATPAYVDAMIAAFHHLGPYIVVAPGIAMPHARPSTGGRQTAMAFVRLVYPIAFGHPDNDPVRLVIPVVGTDDHSHLDMLRTLSHTLSDRMSIDTLFETTDPYRIVEVFTA